MRVLVVGGGGREHALCWRLASSVTVEEVLCAPGNVGIAEIARRRQIDPLDAAAVTRGALEEDVDLVVVGPEAPLVAGAADALAEAGVPVFGPSADAARLESSKSFAKRVMAEAGVPTAASWAGGDVSEALAALDRFGPPYVVKADGLAAGKGVVVAHDRGQAEAAVRAALEQRVFGDAGATLIVESFLDGPEVSVFALTDGDSVLVLQAAQDFKRVGDRDEGPNTGGMGAYCPVPAVSPELIERLRGEVFEPVLGALRARGVRYVGVLYAGLVLTPHGPQVLEFNARFGDPETQVVLPRLRSDLAALLAACAHRELGGIRPPIWDHRPCVGVVLASGGYPGKYPTGLPITGLDEAAAMADVAVFHAGTRRDGEDIVTAGGRVLCVSALGDTIEDARARAYQAAACIHFDGVQYRRDIAARVTASFPQAAEARS
ncbi:MAG: phosphoribosylamine--glycine ligase [Nitriliruptorales bacterium]|nr:phosphoribosylamine--glycine ligase [Nitriliruptorales bacterium]